MEGLKKVGNSLSQKLTQNYTSPAVQQEVKTVKPKKVKLTIYLDEEDIKKLNEICSKKVLEKGKPDKSALISKAVNLLYEAEKGR